MNYKSQENASELVSILPIRTGLPAVYATTTGGEAECLLGTIGAGDQGATLVCLDQRGGEAAGWLDIARKSQKVFTTSVIQVLAESTGVVSDVLAASGIVIDGAAVVATNTFTMTYTPYGLLAGGVTLTARAAPANENEFLVGLNDNATMANLAAAINNHSVLSQYFVAEANLAAVTVTYLTPGTAGNTLRFSAGGGTLTVLASASGWFYGGTGNSFGIVTADPGTIIATDAITIGNVTFTAIAPGVPTAIQFVADAGGDDDVTLANFVAAVNAHPTISLLVTAHLMIADAPFLTTVVLVANQAGAQGDTIFLSETSATMAVNSFAAGAGVSDPLASFLGNATLMQVVAECARRGSKVEVWMTDVGTSPTASNIPLTATLVAEVEPNPYFSLIARV